MSTDLLHYVAIGALGWGVYLRCAGLVCDEVDIAGAALSILWFWCQRQGIQTITPTDNTVTEDTFLTSWVNDYSAFFYNAMLQDKKRMATYQFASESAGNEVADGVSGKSWIDIGCGHDLPLTRMLLKSGVADFVHSIEGNSSAWPHIERRLSTDADLRKRCKVHKNLSTDVSLDERVDGLIHELIGCIASDEGMLVILRDAQKRLLKENFRTIPAYAATAAVPCGPPVTTPASVVMSLVIPAMDVFPDPTTPGIQSIYGLNSQWLSYEPKLVEEFPFDKRSIDDMMHQTTMSSWTVDKPGLFSGIAFGCIVEAGRGGPVLNALVEPSSWGQIFLRLTPPGHEPHLEKGDTIDMEFTVDASILVPEYKVKVWVRRANAGDEGMEAFSFQWAGPNGAMTMFQMW